MLIYMRWLRYQRVDSLLLAFGKAGLDPSKRLCWGDVGDRGQCAQGKQESPPTSRKMIFISP